MKNRLIKIVVFLLLICTFIVVSILVPYKVLKNVLKEYYALSAIFIFFVILVLLLMIKTFLEFKNKVLILKNKDEQIYIRDVEVEYSPAVLSYLMNGEIEIEKDLSATLINLCAKNILKLEKNKIGKFDIIDLKNNKEVEKLSADEKYAYIMFTDKMDNETVDVWKKNCKKRI